MSKHYARAFGGGEIGRGLFGRLDLAKFQTGLQKCLNFMVTPQGPIDNRPGFEYVLKTKTNGAALIPFTYNSEQSFALEVGDQYIRFHTQGGTLLETAQNITGISQAATGVLTYSGADPTNGQWFFLSGIGGMTALNGRFVVVTAVNAGANTFQLFDLFGNAINTTGMAAYTAGGTMARVYEITTPYLAADLFDLHYVQSADVMTITHEDYAPRELRRLSATSWTLTTISFVPTIATPAPPSLSGASPTAGTPSDQIYVTTAVAASTLEESTQSSAVLLNLDLAGAGNYVDVTPTAVAGAVRYNIYRSRGGVFGYIGQSDGSTMRDANIEPDMGKTPPLSNTPFASENPRAASYFDQRRTFGGGGTNLQTVWLTRSATESNMTYSIPTQDDDSITARIVAREGNTIRHLVPLDDLLALTSGAVWKLSSTDSGAITPATFKARSQSYVGASNVQPVVTSDSVLYAQDRGSHIREVTYKWEAQRYAADDVSVLAPHLFDTFTITQLAYSKAPYQVLWATRSDGLLLGLTHQPEHEIKAWHQHDTQGLFKSVCAIPEGDEDGVYSIIEREINSDTVQYIERMHTRVVSDIEDAFFVDCGLTYDGSATSTITGLWHLEGEEVAVLADGGTHPARTVSNGTITLEADASVVHVGLGYNCDAQTMPLSIEVAGFGQGVLKNVNEVWLRVQSSSGIKSGPSFTSLREYAQRTSLDNYGDPPGRITGMVAMKIDPSWQQDGSVCIRQSDPLPLSIQSLTLDVERGG